MPTIKLQSDDTWLDGSSYPISKTGLKSQLKATDALRHKLCYDFVFSLKQACFTDLQQGSVTRFLQLHGLDLGQLEFGQKPERRIGEVVNILCAATAISRLENSRCAVLSKITRINFQLCLPELPLSFWKLL